LLLSARPRAARAALTSALLTAAATAATATTGAPGTALSLLRVTAPRGYCAVDFLAVGRFHFRLARQRHAETNLRVVVEEAHVAALNRQVLRVVRCAENAGELCGDLAVVPDRGLGLLDR